MKIICISIVFAAFLAGAATGGEIWGMVRKDGMPQDKLKVKIFDRNGEKGCCDTDKFGLYSLFLRERGRYDLKVYDEKDQKIYSREIALYNAPVRWNIHLIEAPEKQCGR
jgi:hypothetical protein